MRLALMDGLFDSAWLKWYWADVHTQQLQREVNAWINDHLATSGIRFASQERIDGLCR